MKVGRTGFAVIKGIRHQAWDQVEVSETGPVGDRMFCLVDPVRRRVLRTVENPSLVAVEATWRDGMLTTRIAGRAQSASPQPTGTTIAVDYWGRTVAAEVVDGPWAAALSDYLGRHVVLTRAAAGDVVYGDAVSLLTTASVNAVWALRREHPGPTHVPLDPARFRATFVLDTAGTAYDSPGVEHGWVGRRLAVGSAVIAITAPIVRCAVVDLNPVTGVADLRVLTALPRDAAGRPVLGLQGVVVTPGAVRRGAEAALLD
jgi:uncharacterized protein YcbX